MTNEDIEIHYSDLYGLNKCELLTPIKGPATIRKYNYIARYGRNVVFEF